MCVFVCALRVCALRVCACVCLYVSLCVSFVLFVRCFFYALYILCFVLHHFCMCVCAHVRARVGHVGERFRWNGLFYTLLTLLYFMTGYQVCRYH